MSIRRIVGPQDAEWQLAATPAWVTIQEPVWDFPASEDHAISCLLLDEQNDVASRSVYCRNVRRLQTHSAVQALSQVEVDFDPAAHRLAIHSLALLRKGEGEVWGEVSRAERGDFLLRQREQQLEQQTLTGRLSLVALLEDVRVGDAIDLSWSLEPIEVLPGEQFTALFPFAWNFPVARVSFSVRRSAASPVRWNLHEHPGSPSPRETEYGDRISWTLEDPPRVEIENNSPTTEWPFPLVEVSGWRSWGEVSSFFDSLWADALAEGGESIAAQAAQLRAEHTGEELVREAIRFVQEDIRYLVVDFGTGAGMLPGGAGSVVRRRFGDCKDKSVLLTALLRELGVDACPMLVASNWMEGVQRLQPSNAAFSHAIVSVEFEGKQHYVDPTLIGERGDLEHRTPASYGCGLEIREGADALTPLPEPAATDFSVIETFLLDHKQKEGSVEQLIVASGSLADAVRASIVRDGKSAFTRVRAEALQSYFPALVASEDPADVEDDPIANVIRVRTRHGLPSWGPESSKTPTEFRYGAHGLFFVIDQIDGSETRRQPWVLRYPMTAHHRVVVRGNSVERPGREDHRFSGPGFEYSCVVEGERKQATFDYRWRTTQAQISPEEWPSYCSERDRAFERAGATVSTPRRGPFRRGLFGASVGAGIALGAIGLLTDPPGDVSKSGPRATEVELQDAAETRRAAARALEAGDHRAAAVLLDSVEQYYRNSPNFYTLRGEAALQAGALVKARHSAAAALRIRPKDPYARLLDAKILAREGKFAEAREEAQKLLEEDPNDFAVLWLLAGIAEQDGSRAGIFLAWQRLLAAHPSHPDALLRYALQLWDDGQREKAESVLFAAREAQPTPSPQIEFALSNFLDAVGRKEDAVEPARRAAELAPDDPRFAHRYAMALSAAGDSRGALEEAQRFEERHPGHPLALSAVALAATDLGENRVAEPAFRKWIDAEPGNDRAAANYGLFLLRAGHPEEARTVLRDATRRFPRSGTAWLYYSASLMAAGEVSEAADARKKAEALMSQRELQRVTR